MIIHQEVHDSAQLSITRATELLKVSRSGYYKHCTKPAPDPEILNREENIKAEMHTIAGERTRYGYRRMTAELANRELKVNHKKVLRLMHEESLLCSKKRKYKPITTNSNHGFQVYSNLVKEVDTTGPDQIWVSDITYIPLDNKFVYLATILDRHTKRCVGWDLSHNIDSQLTLNALKRAVRTRKGKDLKGLIHHSDQGVQYAATEYVNHLSECHISISMSSKGNPYENAYAESFFKTVKYEEVYPNEYENFRQLFSNLRNYIDEMYNTKRLHSSIGYKSPIDFEREVALSIIS